MDLIGKRLSFSLNGQRAELEAYPGETLRASYGLLGGKRIWRVSSFSDSTQEAVPARCLIFDGTGWTPNEEFCTAESPAPPTAKPSDVPRYGSDGAYYRILKDGTREIWREGQWWTDKRYTSSLTTEPKSQSSEGAGQRPVDWRESLRPLTTSDGHVLPY